MKLSTLLKVIPAVLMSTGVALADLVTFDDLGNFASISNYHGVATWNNLFALDGPSYTIVPSGYNNGVVSPRNVVFNGSAGDGSMENASAFDLNSGYFTAAWNNNLNLQITGYNGATLLYNNTFVLDTTGPLFLNLNYLGVTKVEFHSFGGTDDPTMDGGGEHFNMDNLTINGAPGVPEAGVTCLMLSASLLGLAAMRRRVA